MEGYKRNAVIFISCHNCQNFISRSIESLIDQTFQDFEILLVDDASFDQTYNLARESLERNFANRFTLIRNDENIGKSANAYFYINEIDAEFVAVLDGDDTIVDNTILAEFAQAYESGYDVVWSNYRTNDGRFGRCTHLDPAKAPRIQGWRSSHFFSFRHSLFKNIPEHYFKNDDRQWFDCACDFSIAYPILDQTRRYRHIDKIAYEYTVDRPSNHHNKNGVSGDINSSRQMRNAHCVLSKKPMPLINI